MPVDSAIDGTPYWAWAGPPWLPSNRFYPFNTKGPSGPYKPNFGPRGPNGPINPTDEPPDFEWTDKEMARLLESMHQLMHLLAEGRTEISIPVFLNPCKVGIPNLQNGGACPTVY
jgi:hypothetical protein